MAVSNGNSIEIGQSEQELMGSGKSKFKKILVACLVALIVIGLLATAIVLLTGGSDDGTPPPKDGSAIGLEDILYGRLQAKRFNGSWVGDSLVYRDKVGAVIQYDPATLKPKVILNTDNEELAEGFKFELSADERYLLVGKGYRKIFRHSFMALYDIVDLQDNNKVIPITVKSEIQPLNLAQWSPNGSSLIFVHQNNLYHKASPEAPEVQITNDGTPSLYNGIPDWVYEEEVFSSNIATWFSPDGQKIAFIRFDDTQVPLIKIPVYGPPGFLDYQYPKEIILHYPKAGAKNPEVKLYTVDLTKPTEKQEILTPSALVNPNKDHIISTVGWADNDTMISIWKNRVQNYAIIQSCDENNNCQIVQEIKSSTGWLELFSEPIFNADGSQFVIITSQNQGNAGGYRHVTMISSNKNDSVAITKGKLVVTEILKWDAETNLIFYSANTEKDSQVLHIYGIKGEVGATPICMTCNLDHGPKQSYFSAELSDSGNYVIVHAQGPNIPHVDLYEWSFKNNTLPLKLLATWETNDDLKGYLSLKKGPQILHHQIELDNGYISKVLMLLPQDADLSGKIKYPMLVEVYGGPNSFMVTDTWSMDWGSYMAANRSVIYAKIDGRGSGLRGDKILHALYEKLGTVEIEDQINTAKKLQEKLPYVDPARTAIWGWSYGGYASAMSLAKDDKNVFKCAVSVAPVTDWTYYDSIYTERYMRLPIPSDNKENYEKSRLTALAENFRNKTYLLIHGTLDDNVHFQQSMVFSRALEVRDIMFKQVSYPDEDHGLAGVRPHLYHTLGRFFNDCFNLKE